MLARLALVAPLGVSLSVSVSCGGTSSDPASAAPTAASGTAGASSGGAGQGAGGGVTGGAAGTESTAGTGGKAGAGAAGGSGAAGAASGAGGSGTTGGAGGATTGGAAGAAGTGGVTTTGGAGGVTTTGGAGGAGAAGVGGAAAAGGAPPGVPPAGCGLLDPTTAGAACGEGACTAGTTCTQASSSASCVRLCHCKAGAWSCDAQETCGAPALTVPASCAVGSSLQPWLEGPSVSSVWLTSDTLYVTAGTWLLRAKIGCGAPEPVGVFDQPVRVAGALPEGLLLITQEPMMSAVNFNPIRTHLFRLGPRSVEDAPEAMQGGMPSVVGERVVFGSDGHRRSYAWGADAVDEGPIVPADAVFVAATASAYVSGTVLSGSQPPYFGIQPHVVSTDNAKQTTLTPYSAPQVTRDGFLVLGAQQFSVTAWGWQPILAEKASLLEADACEVYARLDQMVWRAARHDGQLVPIGQDGAWEAFGLGNHHAAGARWGSTPGSSVVVGMAR